MNALLLYKSGDEGCCGGKRRKISPIYPIPPVFTWKVYKMYYHLVAHHKGYYIIGKVRSKTYQLQYIKSDPESSKAYRELSTISSQHRSVRRYGEQEDITDHGWK